MMFAINADREPETIYYEVLSKVLETLLLYPVVYCFLRVELTVIAFSFPLVAVVAGAVAALQFAALQYSGLVLLAFQPESQSFMDDKACFWTAAIVLSIVPAAAPRSEQ